MPAVLVETPPAKGQTLAQQVSHIAAIIASDDFPTGDRAALKRQTPTQEPSLTFYRFAFGHLEEGWQRQKGAWITICSGIALMCPHPHRPDRPAGQALAETGYSEARLERLLAAEGDVLQTLVLRAGRFLAAKGEPINWTDFARLLLAEDSEKREKARLRIARHYYRHST
jgi:CRISPR type I-E/ECOLI-associated protein CasB/Cse2